MPVIVVGADTSVGRDIVEGLHDSVREIRAFVSDPIVADDLRQRGVKVACGDVSDDSHIEAASTRCFSAVLVAEAAHDERERSFAATPDEVLTGWAAAVARSSVTRVIWVAHGMVPRAETEEVALVDADDRDVVGKVLALDEAQTIS